MLPRLPLEVILLRIPVARCLPATAPPGGHCSTCQVPRWQSLARGQKLLAAVGFLRTRPLYVTGPWAGSPAERPPNEKRKKEQALQPRLQALGSSERYHGAWQTLAAARTKPLAEPGGGTRAGLGCSDLVICMQPIGEPVKKRPTSRTSLDPDQAPLTCSNRSRTTPLCLRRRCGAANELAKVDARVRGHGCIRNGL